MRIMPPVAANPVRCLGLLLVCLLTTIGCSATLRPHIPQPGRLSPPEAPPVPPSEIAVKVVARVDLEERGRDLPTYLTHTEHFAAAHILGLWSIEGDATFQAWQQDDGLHIGVAPDGLQLDLKAYYTANVHVTHLFPLVGCDVFGCYAQCGWDDELPLSANLKAIVKPRWLKAWKATADVSVEVHSEPCLLTAHEIDKTDLIEGAIRRIVEKAVDERVKVIEAKTDIQEKAKKWWDILSAPQPVDPENQVAVALNPRTAFVSPISGSDGPSGELWLVAGITAEPHVYLGAPPANLPPQARFPELDVDVSHTPRGSVEIALPVDITYDEFKRLANRPSPQGLVGEYVDVGKLRATITHVSLHPLDSGAVALAVGLKGGPRRANYEPIRSPFGLFRNLGRAIEHGFLALVASFEGDVVLRGTPRVIPAEQAIRFDEVDFEPQNWNLVYIYANWLGRSRLRTLLQEKAVIEIAPHASTASARMTNAFNRRLDETTTLSGRVTEISLTNLVVGSSALSGYFLVKAGLRVDTVIR